MKTYNDYLDAKESMCDECGIEIANINGLCYKCIKNQKKIKRKEEKEDDK